MTGQPQQHPQRCDKRCEHFDDSDNVNKLFGIIFCKKADRAIEPLFQHDSIYVGCASHSSAGAQQQRIEQVIKAAKLWWRMKRPCEWNRYRHLKHPSVNCVGNDERALAEAVAALLQAGDQQPQGDERG